MPTRFNHLNVPTQYRQYYTKYPEGYTILEALLNWVQQVDNMVDNVNDWNTYMDNFVKSFDTELQATVTEALEKWQSDGVLDDIINTALNTQIDELETTFNFELTKKRDKTTKLGMEDMSPDVLTAIQGGTTVNVLSVPQDNSVTVSKLTDQYDFRGILTSADNLNNNRSTGVYLVQATISLPLNVPTNFQNKTFFYEVTKFDTYHNLERISDFSDPSYTMTRRSSHGSTPTYSDWSFDTANGSVTSSKLAKEFNYKGILNSAHNLNAVHDAGVYMVQATVSAPANVPEALKASTSLLHVTNFEGAYSIQEMYDFTEPTKRLTRVLSGSTVIKDWNSLGNTHKLAGQNLLTMGDSITSPNKYQEQITKYTGASIVNIGYSGAKFTSVTGHDPYNTHSFYELATTTDLTNINHIWVAYGTNDYSNNIPLGTMTENNPAHFKSAMYEGLKTLFTRKPSLKIFFGAPIYRSALRNGSTTDNIHTTPNEIGLYMKEYVDAMKEVCGWFGVPVFDGLKESGINQFNIDTYLSDKLHPNDTGFELIGKRYADFINQYV